MRAAILVIALLRLPPLITCADKPTRNVAITAEDEKWRDPDGYAAIRELHSLMDDDKSGSIDRAESADFLKVDMKVAATDRARRENAFHEKTDESVTVDDLWESWFQAKEREWTSADMVSWLTNIVRLPQYANRLLEAKCTGKVMPRLALQNASYLSEVLRVKNFVHRQKIQLKALDVVLFGVHDSTTSKDIALAILAASLIALLVAFITHRKKSQKQLVELSNQLSELNTMERNFDSEQSENLKQLHTQIRAMEQQLDAQSNYDPTPLMYSDLQPLLRLTYNKELAAMQATKNECLTEMKTARDFVDKMRRKQTSLLNSLKLATGATTGTDDIDTKIYRLRDRMEAIKTDIDELHNRYMQMESILGFQIMLPTDTDHDGGVYSGNSSLASAPFAQPLSGGDAHKNATSTFRVSNGVHCGHHSHESSSSDGAEI